MLWLAATGIVAVLAMLALAAFTTQQIATTDRTLAANADRGTALSSLLVDVQRYDGAVVSVLQFGSGQMDALGDARVQLERDFALLEHATRAEIEGLENLAEIASQLPQVDATRRATELYHAIDMATNSALQQLRAGNTDDARQLYITQVHFRLVNELVPLLANELSTEQKEVAGGHAAIGALGRNALLAGLAIAGLAALAILALALALRRQARRRDEALSQAMRTISAGGWESPLPEAAADGQLGLAQAFHAMAAALGARERATADAAARLRAEMEARSRLWDEANRDLLAAEERRTQFLADVSHQLRTPLTILRGEADLALRARPRLADLRQALGRIETQADEMRQLLEDLVAYARTEAESRLHEPAEIRLGEVIGAAVDEGRALAEQREVSILASLPAEGLVVEGDSRRLKQALLIGLDNAVKHSPPGGHIDVAAARSGDEVAIRIVDDGPGIDPMEQPRVFERFFRGRAEAELLNEGLGIGLPIARQIVERHGGTIALGNEAGRGAVLEIRLPALDGT